MNHNVTNGLATNTKVHQVAARRDCTVYIHLYDVYIAWFCLTAIPRLHPPIGKLQAGSRVVRCKNCLSLWKQSHLGSSSNMAFVATQEDIYHCCKFPKRHPKGAAEEEGACVRLTVPYKFLAPLHQIGRLVTQHGCVSCELRRHPLSSYEPTCGIAA